MDDVDGGADERVDEEAAVGTDELRGNHPDEDLREDERQDASGPSVPREAAAPGETPPLERVRENCRCAQAKQGGQQ